MLQSVVYVIEPHHTVVILNKETEIAKGKQTIYSGMSSVSVASPGTCAESVRRIPEDHNPCVQRISALVDG